MNKIVISFIMVFFICCRPSLNIVRNTSDYNINGVWYQVGIYFDEKPSHMVGPIGWTFNHDTCQFDGGYKKYGYKVSGNNLEFVALDEYQYDEWEEKSLFVNFLIEKNDSSMILTHKNKLKMIFKRHL